MPHFTAALVPSGPISSVTYTSFKGKAYNSVFRVFKTKEKGKATKLLGEVSCQSFCKVGSPKADGRSLTATLLTSYAITAMLQLPRVTQPHG